MISFQTVTSEITSSLEKIDSLLKEFHDAKASGGDAAPPEGATPKPPAPADEPMPAKE